MKNENIKSNFKSIDTTDFETELTVISKNTRLDGVFNFTDTTHIYGEITGKIFAQKESLVLIGESSSVEAEVECDTIILDGFFKGNIIAHNKVIISRTGRVFGQIRSPKLEIEAGAFFEGQSSSPISYE